MNPDFDTMNIPEIRSLIADAERAISRKMEEEKAQVLQDMKTLAEERGFDFAEIVGGKKPRRKIEPKYRNPADASQTWTGMGRKPKWLVAAIEAGKTLDDFKI